MDKTERAYHHAAGRCLDAMQALRRFSGAEAITELQAAIKAIEDEQRRARREDGVRYTRYGPVLPEPGPTGPADF